MDNLNENEKTKMKNIAFIPVRGGSKSIPLKNIKQLVEQPLVYWVLKAACECYDIESVFVATDSIQIKEVVEGLKESNGNCFEKICVIGRSEESAKDTASTEQVMLEFASQYEFENIVLIQATSPLLSSEDLNKGLELFADGSCDSVLSVVRQKRFCWKIDDNDLAIPINYDYYNRPRRQSFEGYLVENGAFYITSKKDLIRTKNRISGRIKVIEMCEESYFEIDEPNDWKIIEAILKEKINK